MMQTTMVPNGWGVAYVPPPGTSIALAARNAVYAHALGERAVLGILFNGLYVRVDEGDSIDDVVKRYEKLCKG